MSVKAIILNDLTPEKDLRLCVLVQQHHQHYKRVEEYGNKAKQKYLKKSAKKVVNRQTLYEH